MDQEDKPVPTPEEFEKTIREMYGIPIDYEFKATNGEEFNDELNGYWIDGGRKNIKGVARNYSVAEDHAESDMLVFDLLTALGYGGAARILKHIEKWYA